MKDHEIIAQIEAALESASPEQRERVEAWARARFGAPAKPASDPIADLARAMRERPEPLSPYKPLGNRGAIRTSVSGLPARVTSPWR